MIPPDVWSKGVVWPFARAGAPVSKSNVTVWAFADTAGNTASAAIMNAEHLGFIAIPSSSIPRPQLYYSISDCFLPEELFLQAAAAMNWRMVARCAERMALRIRRPFSLTLYRWVWGSL